MPSAMSSSVSSRLSWACVPNRRSDANSANSQRTAAVAVSASTATASNTARVATIERCRRQAPQGRLEEVRDGDTTEQMHRDVEQREPQVGVQHARREDMEEEDGGRPPAGFAEEVPETLEPRPHAFSPPASRGV